jgi:hypothetical protein
MLKAFSQPSVSRLSTRLSRGLCPQGPSISSRYQQRCSTSTACFNAFQSFIRILSCSQPWYRSFASQEHHEDGSPLVCHDRHVTRLPHEHLRQVDPRYSFKLMESAAGTNSHQQPLECSSRQCNLLLVQLTAGVTANFYCWIKAQRFHLTQGFTTALDSQGAANILLVDTLPSHIPGQSTHLMEALNRYDTQFQQHWFTQAFTISDPLWTSAPPADHFVRSTPPPLVKACSASQAPASAREPASKRIKLGRLGQTADFICTTALIVPVEPLPSQKAAIATILHRLPRPGCFPTLPDENGTLSYICFQSCFAAPRDE